MTYIEFYDPSQPENICSSLVETPDRIVFFCNSSKQFERICKRLDEVFEKRGMKVELVNKNVKQNDLQNIIDCLVEVIEEYGDCIIDLTGGSDLLLCAAGAVYEKYKGSGLQMHRINLNNGEIIDCDGDGKVISGNKMNLSVEENIILYGGKLESVSASMNRAQREHSLSSEYREQIEAAWSVCRRNARRWNKTAAALGFITANGIASGDGLEFSLPKGRLREMQTNQISDGELCKMIDLLYEGGLIDSYSFEGSMISVGYHDANACKLLTAQGKVLEMKVFLEALSAHDDNGKYVFNDVCTGVVIDWGNNIGINEVDVILMHGITPVFVSCKNGQFNVNELYKLDTVAAHFGFSHSKKAVVATEPAYDGAYRMLKQRAIEMNTRLVDGFGEISEKEINRIIRSLCL